ncbi:MAG: type II toxin-antitoxin system HicA family toxin [Gammaproteobacteria bacterium]|nr:type II toxin-antitoxin system HicA family toxin [Gammaproteobacteria bacterium]MDE0283107.1 type II toxin-antitoxin system HicA family toxin [Gammaproteobacteria bacterium]
MSNFYNIVTREISKLGFNYWKNAKGSHEKWKCERTGKILLVPHNLQSRHTANAILKDAGSAKKI